jgi:hypothetical protein
MASVSTNAFHRSIPNLENIAILSRLAGAWSSQFDISLVQVIDVVFERHLNEFISQAAATR